MIILLLNVRITLSFSSVVNTMESPVKVYIYHVKKSDRGDGHKKKMAWLLRDLRTVDGKNVEKVREYFCRIAYHATCFE